jgi:hypothetical protein
MTYELDINLLFRVFVTKNSKTITNKKLEYTFVIRLDQQLYMQLKSHLHREH